MKETIYHPECKDIFGTIEKLELTEEQKANFDGEFEVIDSFGFEEWYDNYEEAKKELLINLENDYNGSTADGIAEDNRYAAAERFACGGY